MTVREFLDLNASALTPPIFIRLLDCTGGNSTQSFLYLNLGGVNTLPVWMLDEEIYEWAYSCVKHSGAVVFGLMLQLKMTKEGWNSKRKYNTGRFGIPVSLDSTGNNR